MRQRKIKSYLLGFRKDLLDRGLAPMTIWVYMAGVKSFYQINDIELPILPRVGKAVPLEKHVKIPTKD